MAYSAVRKRRKHPAITKSDPIFAKYVQEGDYESAAKVLFWCTLQVGGAKGIMGAIYDANSFMRRKAKRRGL
jgi:hypothetical protein